MELPYAEENMLIR